jgi:hypothetical protein
MITKFGERRTRPLCCCDLADVSYEDQYMLTYNSSNGLPTDVRHPTVFVVSADSKAGRHRKSRLWGNCSSALVEGQTESLSGHPLKMMLYR